MSGVGHTNAQPMPKQISFEALISHHPYTHIVYKGPLMTFDWTNSNCFNSNCFSGKIINLYVAQVQ